MSFLTAKHTKKDKRLHLQLYKPTVFDIKGENPVCDEGEHSPKTPKDIPLYKLPLCPPTPTKSPIHYKKTPHVQSVHTLFPTLPILEDKENGHEFEVWEEDSLNQKLKQTSLKTDSLFKKKLEIAKSMRKDSPKPLNLFEEQTMGFDNLPLQDPESPLLFKSPAKFKTKKPKDISPTDVMEEEKNFFFDEESEKPSTPPRPTQSYTQATPPRSWPARLSVEKVHHNPFSPERVSGNYRTESPKENPGKKRRHSSQEKPSSIISQHSQSSESSQDALLVYFSRYLNDFQELSVLGKGSFGEVTKCISRMDGLYYAIKKTSRYVYQGQDESVLKEVHALATLVDNPHIVRYFASWIEDKRLYIQTELCQGGSLSSKVGLRWSERDLLSILRQIGDAIVQMHGQMLVHLDIKPDNIYISKENIYKLGDLGLVASSLNFDEMHIIEGDSRYLAFELLNSDAPNLQKADIFALGASVYELCRGKVLAERGDEWTSIRRGQLNIEGYSREFVKLLYRLMDPDPEKRPTALELVSDPLVCNSQLSYQELQEQLMIVTNTLRKQQEIERELKLKIQSLENKVRSSHTDNKF
jgi:wee1-like protein kinase